MLQFSPVNLIVIDEASITTNISKFKSRRKQVQRYRADILDACWKTITLTTGISLSRLSATMLLDREINGYTFLTYAEHLFILKFVAENIMTTRHVIAYKFYGAQEAIQDKEASLLYLLSYLPCLNPIKMAFPKLK
ncbi:MAG: hypothetical protein ACTXOO_05630 [Sodalis sp. (in: enterobacteria)]